MIKGQIIYESPKEKPDRSVRNIIPTTSPLIREMNINEKVVQKTHKQPSVKKIVKKTAVSKNSNLNELTRNLLDKYIDSLKTDNKGFTPIHVDEIASRVARFYEKVRKVIDWKEDNALRRGAIERVLKRSLFPYVSGLSVKAVDSSGLSETLTVELIRGGHLPNNSIPRSKLEVVSTILKKYMSLLESIMQKYPVDVKKRMNEVTLTLEICACEIEETLTNPTKEYGLIETMASFLIERVTVLPEGKVDDDDKYQYAFVGVCRALYGLDDNFITYQILRMKYEYWANPDSSQLQTIMANISDDWGEIRKDLGSDVAQKFTSLAERVDTVFLLLDDVLESMRETPEEIYKVFESTKKLTKEVTRAYEARYKTLKTRLFRLAIFSTLSVFLSNWFTFYLVEVPLAKIFYEKFNLFAAFIDFAIPTALMFFLVIIIRPPKKGNIKKVIKTTLGFVHKDENWEHYQIRLITGKPSIFRIFMMVIYFYTMLLVFAGMGYGFYAAGLPITSVIFDTFTITLTVFAAATIKNKAKELSVDEHTSVQEFVLDIISLPIAKVGSKLAAKWKEYNIVAILFNFLIETPFTLILNFIQEWSEFMKERRAELR